MPEAGRGEGALLFAKKQHRESFFREWLDVGEGVSKKDSRCCFLMRPFF
jgi:hypothetical protein